MKILKTALIVLGLGLLAFLIVFLTKDFVVRHDFITKVQLVDYEDYILTMSCNNKKVATYYYTSDFVAERTYDENGELEKSITIQDYIKNTNYKYNLETNETFTTTNNSNTTRPANINNDILLNFLKNQNKYNTQKFKYKGTESLNNRECYVLEFESKENGTITTIYLDKELYYTARIDTYMPFIENNAEGTMDKHIIKDYTLDLNLKEKDLFKITIGGILWKNRTN